MARTWRAQSVRRWFWPGLRGTRGSGVGGGGGGGGRAGPAVEGAGKGREVVRTVARVEDAEGDLVRGTVRARARVRAMAGVRVRARVRVGVRVSARGSGGLRLGSAGLGSAQAHHVKLGRALVQLLAIDCGHLGRGRG